MSTGDNGSGCSDPLPGLPQTKGLQVRRMICIKLGQQIQGTADENRPRTGGHRGHGRLQVGDGAQPSPPSRFGQTVCGLFRVEHPFAGIDAADQNRSLVSPRTAGAIWARFLSFMQAKMTADG